MLCLLFGLHRPTIPWTPKISFEWSETAGQDSVTELDKYQINPYNNDKGFWERNLWRIIGWYITFMPEEALWTKEADIVMSTVKFVVNFLMEEVIYKLGHLLWLFTTTDCGAIKHSWLDLRIGVWGPKRGQYFFSSSYNVAKIKRLGSTVTNQNKKLYHINVKSTSVRILVQNSPAVPSHLIFKIQI